MLNTKDALKLYSLLGKFTPDLEINDSLEFIGIIVDKVMHSDTPEVFAESLLLMYPELTVEELHDKHGYEIVKLFTEGLVENNFLALVDFCERIGYGR